MMKPEHFQGMRPSAAELVANARTLNDLSAASEAIMRETLLGTLDVPTSKHLTREVGEKLKRWE